MKKITCYFAAAAAAVLAIVSCNKNEISAPETGNTRIIIGAKPEEAVESTKTYIEEDTTTPAPVYHAKWSNSGEQLGIIFGTIDDKSKPITLTAEDTTDNDPIFTGEATLDDGTYSFFLFYPRSAYEKCYASGTVGVNLKATQHPVLGSFDPTCDLMGWSTDDATITGSSLVLDGITLVRPMAILRVNLNAPTGGGKALEDGIGSVTGFKMEVAPGESSSDKVVLTGRVSVSPTGGLTGWNVENNYVEASIPASELITIGDNAGFQSIYLVVNPTTIPEGREITFSVETEKYSGANKITRTVTAPADMELEAGKVNTINLTLRDKDFPGTIIDEDYSGDWLITGIKNEVTYAALAYSSGNNIKATAALTFSADGSTISSETDLANCIMTFTKATEEDYAGMYTIQDANGKYLYAAASGNNYLRAKDEPDVNAYWTVTIDGDNHSIIATESSNRNVMRFNPNGNNDAIVSCYASASQSPVRLYPASMISGLVTDPVITFDGAEPMEGSNSKMVTKTVSASATSVEFTFTKNKYVTELPTVSKYSYSGAWFVPDNGWEVTDGKVTVTLTPNTTEYERDNQLRVTGQGFTDDARMYLLIKQEAYEAAPVLTIKSLNDKIRSDNVTAKADAKEYSGAIDNVIVTGVKGSYAFAEDATGGLLIFGVSGLSAGTTFSGDATFKAYMYNKMPEAIAFTQPATTGTTSVIPSTTYTSIADLTSVWEEKMSMRCVLTDVEVTAAFNNKNATVKDAAGNTLTVRDYAGSNLTLNVGDIVTLTGYPAQYNTTKQFAVLDAADITTNTNPETPTLSVLPESLSWAANEYGPSSAKTITVTLNAGVSSDNYFVNGDDDDWDISNGDDIITIYPKTANTGSSAKTFTFEVAHADDESVSKTVTCTQAGAAALTIADLLSGGAQTYTGVTDELLVYAVTGKNAILGDSTGKILLFMDNHGRSAGDIITITNPVVAAYQTVVPEITGGTINTKSTGNTVDHGTPVDLDVASVASAQQTAFSASGFHSAVFVKMTGAQSGRNIANTNTTLYLNQANTTCDGKNVNTTGYIYGYNSSYKNFYYHLVTIAEDSNTPSISVNPESLTWEANETSQKTITVTLNEGVNEDHFTISGSSNDWTMSVTGNTIKVNPKAANTGTSVKTFTFDVVHADNSAVKKTVTCTQKKVSSGGTSTAYLTGENMSSMSNAGTGYGTVKSVTLSGFTWTTNGYQTSDLKNMIQLRKRNHNSGVSYLALPTFPGNIQSITMDVTKAQTSDTSLSAGSNPDATIGFQAGTTSNEAFIVSGTATNKSITLDLSAKECKTGYIVADGFSYRIWSVTVVYNNN